jgi:hypothetical protein
MDVCVRKQVKMFSAMIFAKFIGVSFFVICENEGKNEFAINFKDFPDRFQHS